MEDIAELDKDDPEEEAYQNGIRDMHSGFRAFAPLINRVSGELNRCIFDASDALGDAPGTVQSENKMRGTMKKFVKRCRMLVGLLGCAGAGSVEAYQPVAIQGHIASLSHAPSSSRLVEDEEEEEEEEEEATYEEMEEEGDESNGEDEYDEDYGPPTTQSSQASQLPPKRNPKKKDLLSPDPFQRPVPRRPKKKTEELRSKSNEDRTSKRGRSK